MRQHVGVEDARVLGGHHSQDEVRRFEGPGQIRSGADVRRQLEAGEEGIVFPRGLEAGGKIGFVEPQADGLKAWGEDDR